MSFIEFLAICYLIYVGVASGALAYTVHEDGGPSFIAGIFCIIHFLAALVGFVRSFNEGNFWEGIL